MNLGGQVGASAATNNNMVGQGLSDGPATHYEENNFGSFAPANAHVRPPI